MAERLTKAEVQQFGSAITAIFAVIETVLNAVFDEESARWSERKLRIGAAMSALELASHSKLQPRRALWHASMVLMTLKDLPHEGGGPDLLAQVAGLAHTLSLASIACDSEMASAEAVQQTRAFLDALGEDEVSWSSLLRAHRIASE